jgi:hypothetical protein
MTKIAKNQFATTVIFVGISKQKKKDPAYTKQSLSRNNGFLNWKTHNAHPGSRTPEKQNAIANCLLRARAHVCSGRCSPSPPTWASISILTDTDTYTKAEDWETTSGGQ